MSGPAVPVALQLLRPTPAAPTSPRVAPAVNGVTVSWGDVVGLPARVRVYRYERGNAPQMVAEVAADPPEYLDRAARPGTRYFYYLTLVIDNVEGARTAEMSVRR